MAYRIFVPLLFISILGPTTAGWANTGLCASRERAVFSCETDKGVVSICEDGVKLHYRFGKPGNVEMSYPADDDTASPAFNADTLTFSGGGGAYVTFIRKGLRYTIFRASGRWGQHDETTLVGGVAVARGDKEVTNLACHGGTLSSLGPSLFRRDGLHAETPPYDFEIPDGFFP
ncbi:hypothetical protein AA101099_1474 [Neoasaia chiangmaiensis NBRC 101099]|uniref:Uncharacterized protein n=1 Tax=Neoasaia chiangmaiensis TaxID=320497 RepID=A0A1U9KQ32_9PROT|nr:hypothetical protein [Neoasaia chiangmaiensis]AQS87951.1 hypothetical protein A0U93_08355 [Neoasaia chiangmaiensis]GBR38975.1 hypothetical protein AA101099_1474 [Neoasaia chiangmaiensis NBRC 101099]GEN15608.1 hypothetical protein NCH01_20390 [Neoasaia chiangmaiensis]